MGRRILWLAAAAALTGCSQDTVNNVVVSAPASIERVSGHQLVGVVGSRSSDPLVVRVRDAKGNPSRDVQVVLKVESGNAALDTNTEGHGYLLALSGDRVYALPIP